MQIFTIHAAKTQLSRLIEAALAGEDVVIAKGDKPVVRLRRRPETGESGWAFYWLMLFVAFLSPGLKSIVHR